jgi:glycosyltransferase involved in cell wall biosynthesis
MKIAFVDTTGLHYDPLTPFQKPLGGTQSAACFLSAAVAQRGNEVWLLGKEGDGQVIAGVHCQRYDAENPAAQLNGFDAVIVLTVPIGGKLRESGVTAPLVLWLHNSIEHGDSNLLNDPAEKSAWSRIAFVSEYQKKTFADKFGLDGQVLKNAMTPAMAARKRTLPNFVARNEDPVLVYASAPGRGLETLLIAFPSIRKRLPNARLKIFSSQSMYQIQKENDGFEAYYELARSMPGVEYVGCVSQERLSDELMRCDVWAYPTIFLETSCIVLMEAAAAGCFLFYSETGALPETGGNFGRRMKPLSFRAQWCGSFARGLCSEIDRLRQDPQATEKFFEDQVKWFRETYTWDRRAEEWELWLTKSVIAV